MYKRALFLAVVFGLTIFSGLVNAESTTFELSRTYRIYENGRAEVEIIYTATNAKTNEIPSNVRVPISGSSARNEVVTDQGGNTLDAVISSNGKHIDVSNISDTSGDKNWKLTVSYESDLGSDFGASHIFAVQPDSYGDIAIAKDSVEFSVDVALGVGITRGMKPTSSSQSLGEQLIRWDNNEGQISQTLGVVFGEVAVAGFSSETTLKNNSWWWQEQELVLPPDTNQQKVVLETIEPKPSSVSIDEDGNIIARFSLRPKQSKTVWARGEIHNHNYTYDMGSTSTVAAIPQSLKDSYLQTNDTWQSGQVEWGASENPAVVTVVRNVFDAVVDQIPDDAGGLEQSIEWTNSYIGELRGAGVPARLILGKSYEIIDENGGPTPHAWAEVYIPGTGWISVDVMSGKNGEAVGYSDVRRVGLVMRGFDPNYPPGQLDGYSFDWRSNDDISESQQATPTVSAQNNIIFPGFAIHSVKVEMGPGSIVDNNAVTVGVSDPIKLGSLAPLQTSTTNSVALAGGAFASTLVSYGVVEGDQLGQEVIEATTTNNYIPMIVIFVLIALVVVAVVVYKKRYSSQKDKSKHSKTSVVLASEADGSSIEDVDLVSAITERAVEPYQSGPPELDRVQDVPKKPNTSKPQPEQAPRPKKQPETSNIKQTSKPKPRGDTIKPKAKPEVKVGAAGGNPYKKSNLIQ